MFKPTQYFPDSFDACIPGAKDCGFLKSRGYTSLEEKPEPEKQEIEKSRETKEHGQFIFTGGLPSFQRSR